MIIDCHTHVFPDEVAQKAVDSIHAFANAIPVAVPTVPALLEHMAHSGVDRAVVCPVATRPAQVRGINDWLMGLEDERLIAFGAIHPHLEDVAAELDRLEQAGFKGLKLQPFFQNFELDDPALMRLFELVDDRFAVLLHAGDELVPLPEVQPTPERVAGLLDRFPRLRLIAAHAGGYKLWDEVERHLVGRDLLFDISYTFGIAQDEQLRRIVEAHGYERVLWGSDFPWQAEDFTLRSLREMGLDEEALEAILGGNFEREVLNR
ncbi:MAG: amidohydrolase family protein [Armatimonadia bacterium]